MKAHLDDVAASVPQLRAEAETALNSTENLVRLACRDKKPVEQGEWGDKAYGEARKVGELLNAVNAQARRVPDLETRFTECSAKVKAFNEGVRLVRVSLDEVDGIAERAMAQAADARGRLGTPVSQCATLLRRMDALMGGAAPTAGDRASAVLGHRTYLADMCSQLDATAKTAATEADAVESRGRGIRTNVTGSLRFMKDECVVEPYPTETSEPALTRQPRPSPPSTPRRSGTPGASSTV